MADRHELPRKQSTRQGRRASSGDQTGNARDGEAGLGRNKSAKRVRSLQRMEEGEREGKPEIVGLAMGKRRSSKELKKPGSFQRPRSPTGPPPPPEDFAAEAVVPEGGEGGGGGRQHHHRHSHADDAPVLILQSKPHHQSRRKGARPEDNRSDVRKYSPAWWIVPSLLIAVLIVLGIVFTVVFDTIEKGHGAEGAAPLKVTMRTLDIVAGTGDADPSQLTAWGDTKLLFNADGKVWVWDKVSEVATMLWPRTSSWFCPISDTRFAFAAVDSAKGSELHVYDFAQRTGYVATDINPGTGGSDPSFIVMGSDSALYFSATDGSANHGKELWRFDPATNASTLVYDVAAGTPSSSPVDLVVLGTSIFFSAAQATQGQAEMYYYKTDGSQDKGIINNFSPGATSSAIAGLATLAGTHVCASGIVGSAGQELVCVIAATRDGGMVQDLNPDGSSQPAHLQEHDGDLFFSALVTTTGRELYRYDVEVGKIFLAADIRVGAMSSNPNSLVSLGDHLFFVAADSSGKYLMRAFSFSDGVALVQTKQGSNFQDASELVVVGDTIFFILDDADHGLEVRYFQPS
jgi:ELWxxDGT repeat protein